MKDLRTFQSIIALASLLVCLIPGSGSAGEWTFVGARYQGMGGAGVATVNDSLSPYWNPAALAMAQSYDGVLNMDIMASIEGDVLEVIDNLEDSQAEVDAAIDRLGLGGELTDEDVDTLNELLDQLERLGEDGTGVIGTGSAGLNMRWKNYAVFSRGQADFAIDPIYDDTNVEFVAEEAPNSLVVNESGARVRGLGVIESGVGYGHSFFDGLLNVGANLKYMRGITFTKYVGYQTIEDVEFDFGDSNLREESGSFGLDIGLMSKPFDFLQVGLVARNVNSPKFKTGRDGDPEGRKNFTVDAQVRMGAAFFPFSNDTLVIATDLDLTENKSDLLSGYKSRLWSLGAEYKIPIPVVSIALRAGGYMNAASGADHAFVLTGGLGLKVWLLTLDLAGGLSPAQAEIKANGDKYPSRVNLSAVLGIRGNF
ncbi:MAG: conjugal transfer protein TraF [Proteobacteria bacterium]|nr:conjugal transfer protein TraF [Pseudomonadota bacterium]